MVWSHIVPFLLTSRSTPPRHTPQRSLLRSYYDPLETRDSFWREHTTLILGPSKRNTHHWTVRTNRTMPLINAIAKVIATMFMSGPLGKHAASIARPCPGQIHRGFMTSERPKSFYQEAALIAGVNNPLYKILPHQRVRLCPPHACCV